MDVLYLKWINYKTNEKFIIGALCRDKDKNMYYFKLSKEHVERAKINGFSMATIPFDNFDIIYKSNVMFSMFQVRVPKIEKYSEEEKNNLLEKIGLTEFDEFGYLEKTGGILATDYFLLEKEIN